MYNESLIKFSQLPMDVRYKISSPQFLGVIDSLSEKYHVKLYMLLIMLTVGDMAKEEIEDYLVESFQISNLDARKIKMDIISNVINQFPPFYFLDFYLGEGAEGDTEKEKIPELAVPANEILQIYVGGKEHHNRVSDEDKDLQQAAGKDAQKLREEFYKAVQNKNTHRTIAILRIMAASNDISALLAEDKKLKRFLEVAWEKKYGKDVSKEFHGAPSSPKFVQMFLQYVLEERLGMKTGDAARVGAQLGSIYKKTGKLEYAKMAYFDMERREFCWLQGLK